jgi:hypothetical protein
MNLCSALNGPAGHVIICLPLSLLADDRLWITFALAQRVPIHATTHRVSFLAYGTGEDGKPTIESDGMVYDSKDALFSSLRDRFRDDRLSLPTSPWEGLRAGMELGMSAGISSFPVIIVVAHSPDATEFDIIMPRLMLRPGTLVVTIGLGEGAGTCVHRYTRQSVQLTLSSTLQYRAWCDSGLSARYFRPACWFRLLYGKPQMLLLSPCTPTTGFVVKFAHVYGGVTTNIPPYYVPLTNVRDPRVIVQLLPFWAKMAGRRMRIHAMLTGNVLSAPHNLIFPGYLWEEETKMTESVDSKET